MLDGLSWLAIKTICNLLHCPSFTGKCALNQLIRQQRQFLTTAITISIDSHSNGIGKSLFLALIGSRSAFNACHFENAQPFGVKVNSSRTIPTVSLPHLTRRCVCYGLGAGLLRTILGLSLFIFRHEACQALGAELEDFGHSPRSECKNRPADCSGAVQGKSLRVTRNMSHQGCPVNTPFLRLDDIPKSTNG
jgi:hypothetical protein